MQKANSSWIKMLLALSYKRFKIKYWYKWLDSKIRIRFERIENVERIGKGEPWAKSKINEHV